MRTINLFVAGLLLAGCTANISNLDLEVHPDGSGSLAAWRLVPPDAPTALVKGLTVAAEINVEFHGGVFASLEKLDVGGIRSRLSTTKDGFELRVTVPTSADSAWFKELGLDAAQLKNVIATVKRMDEAEPNGKSSPADHPSFVLKTKLPGDVTSVELIGPDAAKGWVVERRPESAGLGHALNAREATLTIPLPDLMASKVPSVTLVVNCGPITADGRRAWDKTRKQLK